MEASWTMVMVIGKGNCERMVLPSTPLLEDTTYQQTQTKMILSPSFISFLVMKLILLAVDDPLGPGSVCRCHTSFHIQDMTTPRTKNLLPLGCHLFVAGKVKWETTGHKCPGRDVCLVGGKCGATCVRSFLVLLITSSFSFQPTIQGFQGANLVWKAAFVNSQSLLIHSLALASGSKSVVAFTTFLLPPSSDLSRPTDTSPSASDAKQKHLAWVVLIFRFSLNPLSVPPYLYHKLCPPYAGWARSE